LGDRFGRRSKYSRPSNAVYRCSVLCVQRASEDTVGPSCEKPELLSPILTQTQHRMSNSIICFVLVTYRKSRRLRSQPTSDADRSRPRKNRGRLSRIVVVRRCSWTRVPERLAISCKRTCTVKKLDPAHAARSYSRKSPPRRSRRFTVVGCVLSQVLIGGRPFGGRRPRLR